jgi:hypothetical protein
LLDRPMRNSPNSRQEDGKITGDLPITLRKRWGHAKDVQVLFRVLADVSRAPITLPTRGEADARIPALRLKITPDLIRTL